MSAETSQSPALSVARNRTYRESFPTIGAVTLPPRGGRHDNMWLELPKYPAWYGETEIDWTVGSVWSLNGGFSRGIHNASPLKKYVIPSPAPSRRLDPSGLSAS